MPDFIEKGGPSVLPVPALPQSHTVSVSVVDQAKVLGGESLKAVIENYLQYYASGESHTARAKRYDLGYFLEFLAGSPANVSSVRVSDWTLQTTQNYIDYRLSLGEAPATVARRLATIKHFGRTLAERVHGYINPSREVKSPVLQQTKPHGLSAAEVDLLRSAAAQMAKEKEDSFPALRNQFLLELLLATGLRADEVRLLLMSQISDDRQWLKNVKTKGRKFRNVYLDSYIRERLDEYLQVREAELNQYRARNNPDALQQPQRLPVLLSLHRAEIDRPNSYGMAPKTIWRVIAEFGAKAQALASEPIGNLHPHRLRHTFAHGLLDSSKDVRLVAQALGHSDVRTTMRYTERTEEEIAKAIEVKLSSRQ